MAIIPTQNKYPDRAGYTVLNTDTNQLEVFSDGTYKPVGEPFSIFTENIDITVGPGGDFTDVNEALAYIQYLQPKFRTVTEVVKSPTGHSFDQFHLDLQINLIFKEGYVFTHPIVFENVYAPWLNITQENLAVPLDVNIPYDPVDNNTLIAIGMWQSHLRNITLNVKNINLTNLLLTPLFMVNSTLNELRLEVQDVQIGVYMSHNSVIKQIKHFIANRMKVYGIYLCYNSYAMVNIEAPNEFNVYDVGITYDQPYAAAICLTESKCIIYSSSSSNIVHYIDTVKLVFRLRGQSQLIIHEYVDTLIDNVQQAILFGQLVNAGTVSVITPLHIGTNINAIFEPASITPNTYNKYLLVTTRSSFTS